MQQIVSQTISLLCIVYNLCFAAFHVLFWRWRQWPGTLAASGAVNSGITQTLNVMLTYIFLAYATAIGVVVFVQNASPSASGLALTGAGFWLLRTVVQPVLFAPARLSRAMTMIFLVGTILHIGLWWST